MGFAASKHNSLLFIPKGPKVLVCILLYVDDLVVTGPDLAKIGQVKPQLSNTFEMKDLGDLQYFLEI